MSKVTPVVVSPQVLIVIWAHGSPFVLATGWQVPCNYVTTIWDLSYQLPQKVNGPREGCKLLLPAKRIPSSLRVLARKSLAKQLDFMTASLSNKNSTPNFGQKLKTICNAVTYGGSFGI